MTRVFRGSLLQAAALKVAVLGLVCLGFNISAAAATGNNPRVAPANSQTALPTKIQTQPVSQAVTPSVSLAPLKMQVSADDHYMVKGYKGSVNLVASDALSDVTVTVTEVESKSAVPEHLKPLLEEFSFSLKRDGNEIQIVVESPTTKQGWSELLLSGSLPTFNFEIVGPSRPTEIHWYSGAVRTQGVMNTVTVTATDGDVMIMGGDGDVSVNNHSGAVKVLNRKGKVHVDSYNAKVEVTNVEGNLALVNFSGESNINGINGSIELDSYKGVTKLANAKGRLEFKNGVSPLHIVDFEGELRGKSGQGPVFAEIRGSADVRVEAAEGSVNLKLPGSGAWVNLGTEDGSLQVPGFLKLSRYQSQQVRSGRLKGDSGGTVFVRTQSGDIRIR